MNSGSLPEHLRDLEFENPVEALVTAAVVFVELMERLDFTNFKVSMKSTSVPNTIASNRLLSAATRQTLVDGGVTMPDGKLGEESLDVPPALLRRWSVVLPRSGRAACS